MCNLRKFNDQAMRRVYDASVAAYCAKGRAYLTEGNSASQMFRRGFLGLHAGRWDSASRKTLAYAQFIAGKDCATCALAASSAP